MNEITRFTKANGPLTKLISLTDNGRLKSDGTACVMSRGVAQRARVSDVTALATLIEGLQPEQAIGLGALRSDLPNEVKVVTKNKLNGASGVIARTGNDIVFRKQQPAFALLDFDTKGMPAGVASRLEWIGFWDALVTVLPALRDVARVTRCSTSAGLSRSDSGEKLAGSNGIHVYLSVCDGTDIERFLTVLHERCWLAGFGWFMVGAGGQLLERSIVDRMVGAPERLVFEGGPILAPPLQQDAKSRRPVAIDGEVLDTVAACPPLTIVEKAKLAELKAKQRHRLAPESAKARTVFIDVQAKRLVARTGMPEPAARQVIKRQCEGILLPEVELPFDDEKLAGCTVADVLADPDRFGGETLSDPLEGIDYGRCCAKIMRRADGTPWIHSFAHGRTIYELKLDARVVRMAMERADKADVVDTFVRLAVNADLDAVEMEALRRAAATLSGAGLRTIAGVLKAAHAKRAAEHTTEARARRRANRSDPRPGIITPAPDDPWLPQMGVLNDVLSVLTDARPPARDIDCVATLAGKLPVPNTHAFSHSEADSEADSEANQENNQ